MAKANGFQFKEGALDQQASTMFLTSNYRQYALSAHTLKMIMVPLLHCLKYLVKNSKCNMRAVLQLGKCMEFPFLADRHFL